MRKDFWRNSPVAVIGGGNWGTVLAQLISENASKVFLWVRGEEQARKINSTRRNERYLPSFQLAENISAQTDFSRVFELHPRAIIWALPSKASREIARQIAPFLSGEELIIHATKGIEEISLKRVSTVLTEELPTLRVGVLSGPNLATEIAAGEPASTVVASRFEEVVLAGGSLLGSDRFRVYSSQDVVGVEWAGVLKNILAIGSGALDAMGLGWNARAMLISRGLAEMVRFGTEMGGDLSTFLGLAGVGDVLATCSSSKSRNYQVGLGIGQGKSLEEILNSLGSIAEGARTARLVGDFAKERGIEMPITEMVNRLLDGKLSAEAALNDLMKRPFSSDSF